MAATARRGRAVTGRKPCETLKLLHKRSGLSGEFLAKAMGKAAKTSYHRYEDPVRMKDKPIPWRVVERLIPVMVGKGDPPITADELIAISDAKTVTSVRRIALHPALTNGGITPVNRPANELAGAGLPLRYLAEKGSWVEEHLLETRSHGPSSIAAASDWPVENQFVVKMCDVHAMPDFISSDRLHCVVGENPNGKHVVVAVERANLGIVEVLVGKFKAVEGPHSISAVLGNKAHVIGRLLGVVVGVYRRV